MLIITTLVSIILISLFIGILRGGNIETLESIQLADYSPNIASNTSVASAKTESTHYPNIALNTLVTTANTYSISGTVRP